ncbi:Ribosomal RNA-processing protein 7 [Wallemia ichthyophaga EXF-994]|nr:Ribosomal RNA-processing protein 7 [Wallemia ichthyophaga EXF-994]EOR00986.1 Ribosomal RNA-processing protein 7 [Wallemia ichthyophaga EXF-994]
MNDEDIYNTFNNVAEIDSMRRSSLALSTIDYPSGNDQQDKLNHLSNFNRNVHLILKTEKDLTKILNSNKIKLENHSLNTTTSLIQLYKSLRPNHNDIRSFSTNYIKQFEQDQIIEKNRQISNEIESKMEDDGFTLVERGGKHGRAANEAGVQVASKLFNGGKVDEDSSEYRRKKRKFNQPLDDFYRWQRRDKKRHDLAHLRLKFENDKRKVEDSKQNRRYKPY